MITGLEKFKDYRMEEFLQDKEMTILHIESWDACPDLLSMQSWDEPYKGERVEGPQLGYRYELVIVRDQTNYGTEEHPQRTEDNLWNKFDVKVRLENFNPKLKKGDKVRVKDIEKTSVWMHGPDEGFAKELCLTATLEGVEPAGAGEETPDDIDLDEALEIFKDADVEWVDRNPDSSKKPSQPKRFNKE